MRESLIRNNKKIFSNMQILILLMLFMSSMDFMSLHYYFVFIAFALCVISKSKTFSFDFCALMLFCFSVSYILFVTTSTSSLTSMLKPFTYPFCYCIGKNIFASENITQTSIQKQTKIGVIVVSMGAFAHYLLNFAINMYATERITIDFLTKEILSATGQASLSVMAVGVFAAMLFSETSKRAKILSIVGILLALLYNLVLSGRTLILLVLLSLGIAFLLSQGSRTLKKKIYTIIIVIVVAILVIVIYNANILGVKTLISESNLVKRFEIQDVEQDSRMDYKLKYIDLLFEYPFGGNKIRSEVGHHAHDIYLDTYNEVGIIGFAFFAVFMIYSIISTFKMVKNKSLSSDVKITLFCVFSIVMIDFMVEPILQGMPWLFCCFCFIIGMINQITTFEKSAKQMELI